MFCSQLMCLSCHSKRNQLQIITQAGSHGLEEVQMLDQRTFKFQVADELT